MLLRWHRKFKLRISVLLEMINFSKEIIWNDFLNCVRLQCTVSSLLLVSWPTFHYEAIVVLLQGVDTLTMNNPKMTQFLIIRDYFKKNSLESVIYLSPFSCFNIFVASQKSFQSTTGASCLCTFLIPHILLLPHASHDQSLLGFQCWLKAWRACSSFNPFYILIYMTLWTGNSQTWLKAVEKMNRCSMDISEIVALLVLDSSTHLQILQSSVLRKDFCYSVMLMTQSL